ncbi:hypothetical protein ITX31_11640 [Arthrobacter gandavensis]|uniref:hypothetical protein n=1 Tax=Arthrobacter gandavensis TaxID=169960 RepID=UPI0018909E64|nr:hypothetical protein [Arthrobacter gandavensis]MBF4994759.1 hypothetical protein [Arthrobacter gandavensis]
MMNKPNARLLSLNVTAKRARARGEMVVGVPVFQLPPAVERAVARLPRMTLTGVWQERAELMAGTTWKTFGEDIVLTFEPADESTTRVVAVSKPHVATTIFDYGQGKADITAVLTAVAAEL